MLSKGGEGVKTAGRQRSYGVGRKGEESLAFTGNRYTTPVIDEHLCMGGQVAKVHIMDTSLCTE